MYLQQTHLEVTVNTKKTLLIGAAIIAIGLAWTAGFAYYANANAQAQAAAVATPAPSLEPSPAPSSEPARPDKRAMLGDVMATSATYLGVNASDLKTQLQSGKSLADIANATAGKSRDGLVAALTTAADQKIDAQVTAGTLTAQQAATAKQKVASQIVQVVDRAITPH